MTTPQPDRLNLWSVHREDMTFRNLSANTIRDRQRVLGALCHGALDLADVQTVDIRAFLSRPTPSGRPLSPSSRATYLAHVSSFYRWAVRYKHLDADPTVDLDPPKVPNRLPRPIPRQALDAAIRTASAEVRAWLMLGALAGLRCSESASLHADNLRLDDSPPMLRVTGKGGKTRTIPIHPDLAAELAQWPTDGYLFPWRDSHVKPEEVSRLVNKHLRGLGFKDTAHSTRHRFGTDMYRGTRDIIATKDLLGHASVATTQVYAQADPSGLYAAISALSFND